MTLMCIALISLKTIKYTKSVEVVNLNHALIFQISLKSYY